MQDNIAYLFDYCANPVVSRSQSIIMLFLILSQLKVIG